MALICGPAFIRGNEVLVDQVHCIKYARMRVFMGHYSPVFSHVLSNGKGNVSDLMISNTKTENNFPVGNFLIDNFRSSYRLDHGLMGPCILSCLTYSKISIIMKSLIYAMIND